MKDSGVEWIGEIPEDVEVVNNKYLLEFIKGKNPNEINIDKIGLPYIGASDLDMDGDIHEYSNYCNQDLPLASKDDTLILWDGARAGLIGIGHEGYISSTIIKVIPKVDYINKKFWYWYLKGFQPLMNDWVGGTTIPHMNRKFINEICLLKFPLIQQQAIANFLDQKVSEIDYILEKTRESIEEYKKYKQSLITEAVTKGLNPDIEMKDSGIEWIGEIPKHWEVIKIKYISNKIGSGKTPLGGADIYTDEGIMFLRSQNIYNEGLSLRDVVYISKKIDEDMKNTRVYKGDILLNITGGSIGRATIYPFDEHANVNQHVCIIRGGSDLVFNNFIHYTLISNVGYNSINVYQSGANREGLNFEQIGNFEIPLINIEEQTEIIEYLDIKCTEINSLISQKETLLSDLETYKKSLIYECVTGKREVD